MSLASNIVSQRLRPTSELPSDVLMRWNHEPIALYQRNKQKVFYFVWPFLPFAALTILYFSHLTLGMNKNFPFWLLPIIALIAGVIITFVRLLPTDQWIELTEEGVNQRFVQPGGGGYLFSSAYKDIKSCTVSRDSYKGVEFTILKFTNKHKFVSVVGPVAMVLIPENINSDSVLKILRDKGVQVFEK
jgi:hypothetical protein